MSKRIYVVIKVSDDNHHPSTTAIAESLYGLLQADAVWATTCKEDILPVINKVKNPPNLVDDTSFALMAGLDLTT